MSVAGLTQRERVLRALNAGGRHGVSQVDFLLPNVVDGGKPLLRLSARVDELRKAGHDIRVIGRRQSVGVYRLFDAPAPRDHHVDGERDHHVGLFAPEVGCARPAGPYDLEAER